MGEVLEHEPEPRRSTRWLSVLTVVALLAGGGYTLTRSDPPTPADDHPDAPAAAGRSQPGASSDANSGEPWPSAPGACGNSVGLPRVTAPPLENQTGLRLLVGGSGLRVVDVDSARWRPYVRAPSQLPPGQVLFLSSTEDGTSALVRPCGGFAALVRVDGRRQWTRIPVPGRPQSLQELLGAPDKAWGIRYGSEMSEPVLLQPTDGEPPLRMPAGFAPRLATTKDFVGDVYSSASDAFQTPPELATVSRRTGAMERLGHGWVMAAGENLVLTRAFCDRRTACRLTATRRDGSSQVFTMPQGRVPVSPGALSPDGRLVAFLLSRAERPARFYFGHPGGASEVAVQDLVTGRLHVLRGVTLPGIDQAPSEWTGLSFARPSSGKSAGPWLVVALNEGRQVRLLVWRPGLTGLRTTDVRLPGPVLYEPPVAALPGR